MIAPDVDRAVPAGSDTHHRETHGIRVVHVAPAVTEEGNGVSHSVVRLCESLIGAGMEAQVAALERTTTRETYPCVARFPLGFGPRRLGVSPAMHRWLDLSAASGRIDLIHSHSLWMMPHVYSGRVCRRHKQCRLVVSPHGTLSRWAMSFHAVRKQIFWQWLQEPAMRHAACFHATAPSEYEDIRRLGFTQPVCILPNGIDVPALHKTPDHARRQLLFLGRIHPVKGVDILLRAWGAVQNRFREWELHIAGPDDGGYLSDMVELAAGLKLDRVVFRGALFGEDKLRAYRAASLFVLPTHSENFAITVAEAMAAGTPVIVTVGAPWSALPREGAGWWIDIGVEPLIACLEEALALAPERLTQMGATARHWMIRDYSWQHIAERCAVTYRWLVQGGDVPEWVRLH